MEENLQRHLSTSIGAREPELTHLLWLELHS